MLTLEEALGRVLARVERLPAERVSLEGAYGRVLAEEIRSPRNIPPFDNSAMDGFAVRSADLDSLPATLQVLETIPAGGVPSQRVTPGTCARIMTGAPLPVGADAVVMIEDTDAAVAGPEARLVEIRAGARPGQHVRPAGDDVAEGQVVLRAGLPLGPAAVGMLSALGLPSAMVVQRPRVAVLSTGDEVIEAGWPVGPGQIYSSNTHSLLGMIREAGGVGLHCGIAPDDPEGLRAALRRCLRADIILTTGGVSVGDFDYVKDVFEDVGARLDFWKVAIKPGKPLAFGSFGDIPAFGLPGNPVSCVVNFLQFVRPFLRKMMGMERLFLPVVEAALTDDLRKKPGRAHLVRVRLGLGEGGVTCRSTGSQSSGVLTSLVEADGLALLPLESAGAKAGERVRVQVLHLEWLHGEAPAFGWGERWQPPDAEPEPHADGDGDDCC
jgi:molybdopterin molybdotransferase